ncbi:MAG: hypothetical protein JO168_25785 [Solirubrobacterales bacterium]|nr:hypothetical protein [Solirubrobacterales bacterium]MBV9716195.1 hypothetical protein [Solirubrobacterales bacterium]
MTPRFRCNHCADVIGVYEPLVVVVGGEPRETSRAAEPAVRFEPGEHYHRECYLERFEGATA